MDDHVITIHSRIDRWTGRVLCTRPVRPRRMTMTMDLFPQAKMQWAMQGAGRVHSAVVVWGSMFCFRCFVKGAHGVRDSLAPSVVAVARRCVCCCSGLSVSLLHSVARASNRLLRYRVDAILVAWITNHTALDQACCF